MSTFEKQWLLDIVTEEIPDGVEVVAELEPGRSRWYIHKLTIFSFEGKFYGIPWNQGATENQEHEYNFDPSKIAQMEQYEVVVKKWRAVQS